MNLKPVTPNRKSAFCLLVASLLMLTGVAPAGADPQVDGLEVLNTTFASTGLPTNAVVIWDAIGSDPIAPEVETDPFTLTTYFEVNIDNGGTVTCFHEVDAIGINTLALNQTSLTSCNLQDLVPGEEYEVTVTPYYAQQTDEDELLEGKSETRVFIPVAPPLSPTVTAVNSVATGSITVTWVPKVADENIVGWLVEPGDLMPMDGKSDCYSWTPFDPEDPTAEPTDSEEGLATAKTSCTFANTLFDATEASQISVAPIYSEYRMIGTAGIGWIGNAKAAVPGVFTSLNVVQTGEKSAKVSWVLESMPKAPKATFSVEVNRADDSKDVKTVISSCADLESTVTKCTVSKLTAGVRYVVTVTATNDNGEVNTAEEPNSEYFHMEKPLTPDDFAVEVTPEGLNFSWTAVTAPGINLTGYSISKISGIELANICPGLDETDTSCTYSGPLPREENQIFELVALNLSGSSEGLTATATVSTANIPLSAKSLEVRLIDKEPTLTWIPGVTAGAKTTVYLDGKAFTCKSGSSKFICVLGSLSKTKTYTVSVVTVVKKVAAPSAGLTFTLPKLTSAPQVAQKFAGKSVTLTWKDTPAVVTKNKVKSISITLSPKAAGCKSIKVNEVSCKITTLDKAKIYTAKIKIDYVKGADSLGRIVIVPGLSGSKLG